MDKFKFIQGRKSPEDRIMLYNNVAVSFEDVAKMCIFFMKNEDILYPPPTFKGAELFKEYIKEVLNTREIPSDLKYKIAKK
jgi:hypothetical protein